MASEGNKTEYVFFSRGGFSSSVKEAAKKREDTTFYVGRCDGYRRGFRYKRKDEIKSGIHKRDSGIPFVNYRSRSPDDIMMFMPQHR